MRRLLIASAKSRLDTHDLLSVQLLSELIITRVYVSLQAKSPGNRGMLAEERHLARPDLEPQAFKIGARIAAHTLAVPVHNQHIMRVTRWREVRSGTGTNVPFIYDSLRVARVSLILPGFTTPCYN